MPAQPNTTTQKTPPAPKGHPDPGDPAAVPPPRGNQESQHNKHHDTGQDHHRPQKHTPAEEKD
jgi:hypothetical protein